MATDPRTWRRVEAVIDVLLDEDHDLSLPVDDDLRARVKELSDGDAAVEQEVSDLLREMRVEGDAFETPLDQLLPNLLGEIEDGDGSARPQGGADGRSLGELGKFGDQPPSKGGSHTGRSIDRYRLISILGRGGMGVVYLAERADESFEKQVALKLLPWGLEGGEAIRRFRTERQILARLEHPGIARLLDGGITDEGSPYLVMELVQGEPIDLYCERNQLSLRERVELFLNVCAAVRYAHRNLVVHRDLKPNNCMVTAEGEIKLLDFGIGKVLDEDVGSGPGTLLQPMTPRYASPEQLANQPVSTASDVYSLGLLLYRLLTGTLPFDLEGVSPEQTRRLVETQEPPAPSTRLSGNESDGDSVDRRRRELKGDLDVILLKALRFDANERYGSVAELSDDLSRWLERRPIEARPVTLTTRALKFVSRNRLPVAAALLLFLLLSSGVVALLIQGRISERERERAQSEAARAQRVVRLLTDLLQASSADSTDNGERTVREVFEQAEQNLRSQLAGDPVVLGSMLEVMAVSLTSFGDFERALELAEEAVRLIEAAELDGSVALAKAKATLANVRTGQGMHEGAKELLEEALRRFTAAGAGDSVDAAAVHRSLSSLAGRQGDPETAIEHAGEAVRLYENAGETVLAAYAKTSLASALRASGSIEESIRLDQEALAVFEARFEPDHPSLSGTRNNLGSAHLSLGQYVEAEELYRASYEAAASIFGPDHRRAATPLTNLSRVLLLQGEVQEATEVARKAAEILRQALGPEHPSLLGAQLNLATTLVARGELEEAVVLYREGLERFSDLAGPQSTPANRVRTLLGTALVDLGALAEAESLLNVALKAERETAGRTAVLAHAETLLGSAHVRAARRDCSDALPLLEEAVKLLPKSLPEEAPYNQRRGRIERLCPTPKLAAGHAP